MAYTFKVYIKENKEHFEYGEMHKKKIGFPFMKSLLDFLYLDIWSYNDLFNCAEKALMKLHETKEQLYADEVLSQLDSVAKEHIYFEMLLLDWQDRLNLARKQDYQNIIDVLPCKKLTHIPANISTIQDQIKTLFAQVLDMESKKAPIQQKMVEYYNAKDNHKLYTFQFQPQPMRLEVIDHKTFTEVLYPKDIYDIIDYFVRECVKREQRMRVCKNCGKYFALTGYINTEYCDRSIDASGRTCKDMGAINRWTQKRKDDPVFTVYRKEYKKRFAWIKYGKLNKDEFYAWSELARQQKEKCDSGEISLQEFTKWLKG